MNQVVRQFACKGCGIIKNEQDMTEIDERLWCCVSCHFHDAKKSQIINCAYCKKPHERRAMVSEAGIRFCDSLCQNKWISTTNKE